MICQSKGPVFLRARVWSSAVCALFLSSGGYSALAAWDEEAKVAASDGYPGDRFASSVATSGDLAVVGVVEDDDQGSASGSAYVYRWGGSAWNEEQKLLASDGAASDKFGWSLSVSGNVVVIGAPYDDDNGSSSGSAYVFRYVDSTWVEEQKLLPADGAASDKFGYSVAVVGNAVVVGAYGDDDNGSSSGAAYVFRFEGSSWIREQKLLPADGASSDFFGIGVSVSDDVIVVGANKDDDNGTNSGAAYAFRHDGASWVEEAKLLASDGAAYDYLGRSVSVSGEVAIVGAYNDADNGPASGSAYVFHFDGVSWVEEAKLLASDGTESDEFGLTVSVSGNVAVVGAHLNEEMGDFSGAAYVYRFDGATWTESVKLLASDAYHLDEFGNAVAVSGSVIVVGAYLEDPGNTDAGSAYIFEYDDCGGYPLSVGASGAGSVARSPSLPTYPPGQIVDLTPTPEEGWMFDHWEDDLAGSDDPGQITMDGSKTVTAVFVRNRQPRLINVVGLDDASAGSNPVGGEQAATPEAP